MKYTFLETLFASLVVVPALLLIPVLYFLGGTLLRVWFKRCARSTATFAITMFGLSAIFAWALVDGLARSGGFVGLTAGGFNVFNWACLLILAPFGFFKGRQLLRNVLKSVVNGSSITR